nr:hypothetical protein Q903MT_gene333 [Picea sitchensis]
MILKMYIYICNKQTAVVNLSCCDGIASLISSGGLLSLVDWQCGLLYRLVETW